MDPVTLVFILLVVLAWYMYFYVNKRAFSYTVTVLSLHVLFTSPMLANGLTLFLEGEKKSNDCKYSYKAIVVLGGGVRLTYNINDVENLHVASFRRAQGALKLSEKYPALNVIISGGGGAGKIKEADLMSRLLELQGLKSDRIIKERISTNTWENALYTKAILKNKKIDSIYLVTSALHMLRASLSFEKIGVKVCGYFVDRVFVQPKWYEMLIPQVSALVKTKNALHEIVGLAWYYVLGKI